MKIAFVMIHLKSETLNVSDLIKYLGGILDRKGTFKNRIDSLLKQLAKFNGILYKMRIVFSKRLLLDFYEAYAKLKIMYDLLAYECVKNFIGLNS